MSSPAGHCAVAGTFSGGRSPSRLNNRSRCASSLHFLGRAALDDWQRVLRPGGLAAPSNGSQAAEIALDAGFQHVTVQLTDAVSQDRPRRTFLVWATLPIGTERSILKQARINRRPQWGTYAIIIERAMTAATVRRIPPPWLRRARRHGRRNPV
ncbi:MAG: hypothetical protein ACRDRX_22695 [Pseudonocardiaceae bacterium]